jgi:hypothetical protein
MSKSILQAEKSIQAALESLRSTPQTREISTILDLLVPKGYHLVVELQEDGRKKRRTASIENWSPETGEILIYFSRDSQEDYPQERRIEPPASLNLRAYSPEAHRAPIFPAQRPVSHSTVNPSPIQQLCNTLEEVERQGRSFVALKWFRDDVLPSKGFSWAINSEERQAVLAEAVESGAVVTSKIPNPRSPFPTTTIRLNRSRATNPVGQRRYAPVPVQGEPLSTTILRDRGAR